ncbi:MAG: hypothetical protein ACR2IL_11695 [Chitinophagaceae bacterium]
MDKTNPIPLTESNDQLIHNMLKAMESRVDEVKNEIDFSRQMHPLGVETDLIKTLNKLVDDPLSHLIGLKNDISNTIRAVVILILKEYFKSKKSIVKKAYLYNNEHNHNMLIGINLTEDNYENRSDIFSFLRDYKSSNLWEALPITFQIIPSDIEHKINIKEDLYPIQ